MEEGRSVIRDPVTGKFTGATLDPETAAAMGKLSQAKKKNARAGDLLTEAGYDDDNPAPRHIKILAEIAAEKRAGSVPAMRDFLRLTRPEKDKAGSEVRPAVGEACQLCGQVVTELGEGQSLISALLESIQSGNGRS
jgi:hypothetical protein